VARRFENGCSDRVLARQLAAEVQCDQAGIPGFRLVSWRGWGFPLLLFDQLAPRLLHQHLGVVLGDAMNMQKVEDLNDNLRDNRSPRAPDSLLCQRKSMGRLWQGQHDVSERLWRREPGRVGVQEDDQERSLLTKECQGQSCCESSCTTISGPQFDTKGARVSKKGWGRAWAGLLVLILMACSVTSIRGQEDDKMKVYFVWKSQTLWECPLYRPEPGQHTVCCYNNDLETCEDDPHNIDDFEPYVQFLLEDEDGGLDGSGKGVLRSCTSDPATLFDCNRADENEEDPSLTTDEDCLCMNRCLEWQAGYATVQPVSCTATIVALEDHWSLVSTNFKQDDQPLKGPEDLPFLGSTFRVTLLCSYGQFELYNREKLMCSTYTTANPGDSFSSCVVEYRYPGDQARADDAPDLILTFKRFRTGPFQVEIEGTFAHVVRALDDLYYRPRNDQNTNRLRSRSYNPAAARDQPYEKIIVAVYQKLPGSSNFQHLRNTTQLVQIFDINDTPKIAHPADEYQKPLFCVDPASLQPSCHFGQFFSYEDTDRAVDIAGVEITDLDVGETCAFEQPECNKIDVSVRARYGAIGLNTRSRLSFYENRRGGQGFTAFSTPSNSAVRVLFYRVELLSLLGPSSTVYNYNTQHSNQNEFVTLTVSDQGFSGFKGIAKVASIVIDVSIVAVNDAPTISIATLEYQLLEDKMQILEGLSVADTDVDERIESSLARLMWMSEPQNLDLLNRLQVKMNVVHGVLRLGYTRNLRLINNRDVYFLTLSGLRFGHNTCRQIEFLYDVDVVGKFEYKSACVLGNIGTASCRKGIEPGCQCITFDTCSEDGAAVLYLNNSADDAKSTARQAFITAFTDVVHSSDKTCGGQPFFAPPNNMTFGLPCSEHADCTAEKLPPCFPGVNCTCCANTSVVCEANSDCDVFEKGSPCGCMPGGPAHGVCGPFCLDRELTEGCRADLLQPRSGPDQLSRRYGTRCTYRAPWVSTLIPGANTPEIARCQSAAYVVQGSGATRVLDLVTQTSEGSKEVTIAAPIVDVNRALQALLYVTDIDYNRLFRPPVEERDPLTFDIEADNLDVLTLVSEDLGNSGGSGRVSNRVTKSVDMRVASVNDAPVANGPTQVKVMEDIPFHFRQTKDEFGNIVSGLSVSDPDFEDFGFAQRIFTVNISCTHGRVFLNESYLEQAGGDIIFRTWTREHPERRGVHSVDVIGRSAPIFGDSCQFEAQCSDGAGFKSDDKPWGFFKSEMYGLVYSPAPDGESVGCGKCPENAGNKFISIDGTFSSVNKALSLVTYLPDPHFNTRYGERERIYFQVTDNGAIGNDATAPILSDELRIDVVVESVNDRPIIGQLVTKKRTLVTYDGGLTLDRIVDEAAIIAVNKSMDAECRGLPPSGQDYFNLCGPSTRTYIDVDEDTDFYITPDVLWISDVDSDEAEQMPEDRRYCCDEAGEVACTCTTQPCMCGTSVCMCAVPDVCEDNSKGAGELLVQFSVDKGLLSFVPPPGRKYFEMDQLVFLTNSTTTSIKDGGEMEPCVPQIACMVNTTTINIRARKEFLQTGLEQLFLRYRGAENFYGPDLLKVWVSDQGYTDDCYNETLVAEEEIFVRVVGINDPPVIKAPDTVLVYQKGFRCYSDFPAFPSDPNGLVRMCADNGNASWVPPNDLRPNAKIQFEDVDIADTEYGNMTLTLVVGSSAERHAASGEFFLPQVIRETASWYTMFRNLQGLQTLTIQGTMEDINLLMQDLRYDADPTYQGYVPFQIIANDMLNFGECDGDHVCGNLQSCADHREGHNHRPARFGLTTLILDVTVGALGKCGATACADCNQEDGCGWCPGACNTGKCMMGTASGPKFESCSKDREGRGYRQCENTPGNVVALAAGMGGGLVVLMIIVYIFLKWVQRRHGSLHVYMRKKQGDFRRAGRRMHIMPPDEANYNQFFFLVLLMIIVVIIIPLLSTTRPECEFQNQFFIDKASSIYMNLDNCKVRFLPTRFRPEPEFSLEALKVQVALASDRQIELEAETCGSNATFSIVNKRDDAVKYIGYYCNIEILVPDRFTIPQTTIVAAGENITTVRAGPMDIDSPEFGLDFGPNSLTLLGNFLVARLENISAKAITYDVQRGGLIGMGLDAQTGEFKTTDADIIVQSNTDTSVQFWQKSANLVCLTASKGSLYVDDSCERRCELQNSSRRSTGQDGGGGEGWDAEVGLSLRRADEPWLCDGDPLVDGTWNCEQYDPVQAEIDDTCPVGAKYKKRSQVPRVDGCTNIEDCIFIESSRCLCKPACDMANLDPPGECNGFGRCCQTICSGHSKADLFALDDMPRCGIEVDPEKYSWCNGTLGQQWRFTSDRGQIAFMVGMSNTSVSSYKGGEPTTVAGEKIDINEADKIVLNEKFHPGGANNPSAEWFSLRLSGPGTPEASVGEFIWISSTRYLVLEPWIMNVVSLGLLAPVKDSTNSRLRPAFCPAYTDPQSALFQERLVQMRAILLDTLQNYPPSQEAKPIPTVSLLSFKPVEGLPRVFATDPQTNQIGVSLVDPFDYTLIVGIMGLAIGIPVLTALVSTCLCFSAGNDTLKNYRKMKLKQELTTMNMTQVFVNKGDEEEDDDFKISAESKKEMVGRTNFYYMVEEFLGSAESQRTVFSQWKLVIIEMLVSISPTIFVYIIARMTTDAYRVSKCEFRPDTCSCNKELDGVLQIPQMLNVIVYVYFFIAMLEVGLYYLAVPYTLPRRILRHAFYLSFFIMNALSIVSVLTIVLFVFLGILIKPTHLAPYGIAIIGTVACCAAFYAKLVKFQTRVSRAVRKRVRAEKSKIVDVPPTLLDVLIDKNIEQAMSRQGLSIPAIIIQVFIFAVFLVLIFIFLFVGFNAFTDPNDMIAGFINSFICILVVVAAQQTVAKDGDDEDVKDQVEEMTEKIMATLKRVLMMVKSQIDLAMVLFKAMKKDVQDGPSIGESYSESVSGSSESSETIEGGKLIEN